MARLRLCAVGLRNEADELQRQGGQPGPEVLSAMDRLMAEVERSDGTQPEVSALVQVGRAERSRAQPDPTSSLTAWSALAATWQERGRPYEAAYTLWRWAEAATRVGDQEEARPAARQAYWAAENSGPSRFAWSC